MNEQERNIRFPVSILQECPARIQETRLTGGNRANSGLPLRTVNSKGYMANSLVGTVFTDSKMKIWTLDSVAAQAEDGLAAQIVRSFSDAHFF
jgi:hypothetical protein